MKRFLLDTCVVSEPLKKSPDANLVGWWREQNELSLYLSTLVVGELEKGIQKLPQSSRRDALIEILETIVQQFGNRILPVNTSVSRTWGILLARCEKDGRPMPAVDGLIAATALTHGLIVVTRNVGDFIQSGVEILNPFDMILTK